MQSIAIIQYDNHTTTIPNEFLISDIEIKNFTLSESQDHDSNGIIGLKEKTLGDALNQVLSATSVDGIIFIDNKDYNVRLTNTALELVVITSRRHPGYGYIYSDYKVVSDGTESEIHLLHHHIGRVRDNQDYGRVFYFNVEAVKSVGGFDASLHYSTLYDIRLKLSEEHEPVHISNRYDGSLYSVEMSRSSSNVFDYLMASKDAQLEAEHVVTEHLKRIGAYLAPGEGYNARPDVSTSLTASIIIPVNNRPEFIGTAIRSVQAQTVKDVEIIVVVNGGESDTTIQEVEKYRLGGEYYDANKPPVHLLVLDINNIGLCLNLGSLNAKGKYYVQLDSDDRLKPDAVQKIVDVFESDPHIGMVIGSYEVWEKNEAGDLSRMEEIPVVTHDEWTEENGRNNLLRINGAGAPRSIPINLIRDMGYFGMNDDPYARNYGEDYDMVLHISERYKIGRVWDPIYDVIRHAGGTDHAIDQHTVDRNDNAKDRMRLEAIQRRQKMGGE